MFVTTETVLGFGVDINTLKTGCKNYRSGKSQSWKNEKDYRDARKVLIVYDTIPATTKRKYNMPETYADYWKYLQSEENKKILAELEAEAKKTEYEKLMENPEFVAVKTALERDFVKHTARYRELLEGTPIRREKLRETAETLAKRHALYELLIRFTGEYRNLGTRNLATEDLILFDLKSFKDITDFTNGTPKRFAGFNILEYTKNPVYDSTTLIKKPFDAITNGNDTYCSFAFSSDEVMKADGTLQMYERVNDPEMRGTVVGFDKRFIALPIRNKGIGALVTAKI